MTFGKWLQKTDSTLTLNQVNVEKVNRNGPESLTDFEIMALILNEDIEVVKRMMDLSGGIVNMGRSNPIDFEVNGATEHQAAVISAVFEIGRRRMANAFRSMQMTCTSDITRFMTPMIAHLTHEVFVVICLGRDNRIISSNKIFSGGVASVTVDCKMIFKEAIQRLASAIVLCHNHPSGRSTPSNSDDRITRDMVRMSKAADIVVIDHIIIAGHHWYSYADLGRIKEFESEISNEAAE